MRGRPAGSGYTGHRDREYDSAADANGDGRVTSYDALLIM
ncbi:MAG: hypothetical protein KAR25_01665 [Methanosarcinales archaeon]|nr:hypothetical protein [Methanosarcinales archaeon]